VLTNPQRANRLTFDLDPDPKLASHTVREAAVLLRESLDEFGLTSFLKTTGGKGLHVVVPLSASRRIGPARANSHG
jgi:bifunctional non-homologous end joining protein LigD